MRLTSRLLTVALLLVLLDVAVDQFRASRADQSFRTAADGHGGRPPSPRP